MNVIAGAAGIAPVVGPLLGAAILQFSHWRVSFWLVAALGLLMLAVVALGVPETLPPARRHGGGWVARRSAAVGAAQPPLRRLPAGVRLLDGRDLRLRRDVRLRAAVDERAVAGAYSVDFAVNAVGLTVTTLVRCQAGRTVSTRDRRRPRPCGDRARCRSSCSFGALCSGCRSRSRWSGSSC